MSGGAKKRTNRSEGWEEAGVEFYQESYPTNPAEFDVLQHNPKHLTTLLPSKQTRAVAATIRMRNNASDTRTFRRNPTMRRESATIRRQSVANEVQLSMMPDLSEFSANEKSTWLEIMEIKAMPIPMSQKKEHKAKLQVGSCLRLQGYEQFKWRRRKLWEKTKTRMGDIYQKTELWRGTLKRIEGNFGTGVVSYFLFIKWLMFLNLAMFALTFFIVILPTILAGEFLGVGNPSMADCNDTDSSTMCCTVKYFNTSTENSPILDFFQGTGQMEKTLFFYGFYPNMTIKYLTQGNTLYYNIPLAYVGITCVCFLLTLFAIVRSAAEGFKERLVEGEGQFYMYCNMIFGSWDFCIDNQRSAGKKHEAICKEIKSSLESERLEDERKSRTRDEKTKIIIMRILFHLLVLTILVASVVLIYIVFDLCVKELKPYGEASGSISLDSNNITRLFYEFLPSIVIVLLNMIVPLLFNILARFENYSPMFQIRLSLIRTIALRLSALAMLYASIYLKVSCEPDANECASDACNTPACWETFVGQQMYKLALTDFANHIIMTFIVNFVRSRIGKLQSRCAKFVGEQAFELPRHVLDVIYLQTVCWFGSFYAPFLPAMITIILFLMFHIKKFACLVNSQPSLVMYRVSRSNSMFMIVLLVSYAFAMMPVVFSIAELLPSKSCGPFRGSENVWIVVSDTFRAMPQWLRTAFTFFTTAGFAIPVLVLLGLMLYYYVAVTSANRHMVVVLKNQLVLEGHDKQFLLEKLSSFIRQQQKRTRHSDLLKEGERNIASN